MSESRLPLRQRLMLKLLGLYPPFLGAGIHVRRLGGEGYRVTLGLHWWNRNFVGTHFGGSLYTMTDPFYVLTLFEQLGWDYVIWNMAAEIEFLEPGRGTVSAEFRIPPERVAQIRAAADRDGTTEPEFVAEVLDERGDLVARMHQTLYVRRKDGVKPASG